MLLFLSFFIYNLEYIMIYSLIYLNLKQIIDLFNIKSTLKINNKILFYNIF